MCGKRAVGQILTAFYANHISRASFALFLYSTELLVPFNYDTNYNLQQYSTNWEWCGCTATGNHHQAAAAAATVAASTLLSQASSDSEPSRYRIRLSGSQANILTTAGIDVLATTGPGPHKKSSERDTHSAVSSSKQMHHQHGLFVPMQNMRQNVSEKVAQVRVCDPARCRVPFSLSLFNQLI